MTKDNGDYTNYFEKFKESHKSKAEEYANNKEKTEDLLKKAIEKANQKKGPLSEIWEKIQLLFSLVGDYSSGKYRKIPFGSIILIIIGIIYFVSPIDLFPDFIPVVGLIDDVAILGLVIRQINADLEKYKAWKDIINLTVVE